MVLIVFVCTGNICRSPMAEAVARDRHGSPDLTFASAGTFGVAGSDMSPDAARALAEIGVRTEVGVSQSLDTDLIDAADLVYAMEPLHLFWIINRWPEAEGKVQLLDPAGSSIDDPYGFPLAEYRRARDAIVDAIEERAAEWV